MKTSTLINRIQHIKNSYSNASDKYRISHGLGLDMIFYPMSFVFTTSLIKIISKPWEIFFLSHAITPFLSLHYLIVTFYMQKCLTSFQHHCVIFHCDVIAVVYEKLITWVISNGYRGNHVITRYIHLNHTSVKMLSIWLTGEEISIFQSELLFSHWT